MNFENMQIEFKDIPTTEQVVLKPIESNYKKVIVYTWLIVYAVLLIAAAIAFVIIDSLKHNYKVIGWGSGILLLFIVVTFFWIHIEFKYRSFAIRQKDILYKSGWLFQKTNAVPYSKIQHCSVVQGFISRLYRLANINIYTAASNNFDISIKGLKIQEAEQLKDWLMQQNNNYE